MVTIKPHHFIDIITAYGDGQTRFEPHPYGHAVHSVAEQVLAKPDTVLRMELGADDICVPCMHNERGQCQDTIDTSFRPDAPSSKREWNLRIDERWCERLGLAQGEQLTAREFCERLSRATDNIDEIYREVPRAMTAERLGKVRAGVARFLGAGSGSREEPK